MRRHLKSITAVCVLMMIFAFIVMPAAGQAETPYIAWSPNGTMLAVGHGATLDIVDAETMTVLNSFTDLEMQVTEAAWSPDGSRLAVANGADVEVWEQAWSSEHRNQAITYQYYVSGNPPDPSFPTVAIAWSHDGSMIASATGSAVDLWDSDTGTRIRLISGNWDRIHDVVWDSDGRLALASGSRYAIIVDSETGDVISYFFPGSPTTQLPPGFWSLAFSPDGNDLMIGTGEGLVMMWGDTRDAQGLVERPERVFRDTGQSHSDYVFSLSWSVSGKYIASSSRDGTIRIWDAETGEQLEVIDLGGGVHVNSVAWSPDGSKVAYGNPDGSVTLFDATQLPGYAPMATPEAPSND